MGQNRKMNAERIETVDGVGYLYGGKMYSQQDYESILTGQGVDGNMATGGTQVNGKKKSPVSQQNVLGAGDRLIRETGGIPTITPPAPGNESNTQNTPYQYSNPGGVDDPFFKMTRSGKPLSEGEWNMWMELTQKGDYLDKRDRLRWLTENAPKALPVETNVTSISNNPGVASIDPTTGQQTIQLPTQVVGGTSYQPQPKPVGQSGVQTTSQTTKPTTQKYMGKEVPVIEAGSFGDAMRQFASQDKDPMGKVFWWNGKAYKYAIAQTSQQTAGAGKQNIQPKSTAQTFNVGVNTVTGATTPVEVSGQTPQNYGEYYNMWGQANQKLKQQQNAKKIPNKGSLLAMTGPNI